MGRKRKPKVKIGISIDADLLESIRSLIEAECAAAGGDPERAGGVSGVIEECVRRALTPLRQERTPELVERLELLQFKLQNAKREMVRQIADGEFDEGLKDRIMEYEMDIHQELQDREIKRLMEERRQRKAPE